MTFLRLLIFPMLVSSIFAGPINNRIIGGDFADPGQFPFIVSIQLSIPNLYDGHFCGGSILNNKWILTASHCVLNYPIMNETWAIEQVSILVGTNVLDVNGTSYKAEKLIPHPHFNVTNLFNDIALIKIDGNIEFSDLVQTIQIGGVDVNDSSIIAGWGAVDENPDTTNELRYLEVSALSEKDCAKLAAGSPYNVVRGPGQVCVYKGVGHGACHGDSGGPMIFDGKLVGVTSYTMNNWCAEGYPDVYTRTAYYTEWIQEVMDNN